MPLDINVTRDCEKTALSVLQNDRRDDDCQLNSSLVARQNQQLRPSLSLSLYLSDAAVTSSAHLHLEPQQQQLSQLLFTVAWHQRASNIRRSIVNCGRYMAYCSCAFESSDRLGSSSSSSCREMMPRMMQPSYRDAYC